MDERSSSIRSVDGSHYDDEDWLRRNNSTEEATTPNQRDRTVAAEPTSPAAFLPPLPRRAEPTLKERLVERERQARVETERARLKRQFALSSNGGVVETEEATRGEHGSVAGTVGEESSVAAPPMEEEAKSGTEAGASEPLGYAMERFLADRTGVKADDAPKEAETTRETGVIMERFLADRFVVDAAVPADDQAGIVTEEEGAHDVELESEEQGAGSGSSSFASDFIGRNEELDRVAALEEAENAPDETPAHVVEDVLEPVTQDSDINATVGSIRSYSSASEAGSLPDLNILQVDSNVTSTTLEVEAPSSRGPVSLQSVVSQDGSHLEEDTEIRTIPSQELEESPADDTYPRVFRLTEAEIQEMAAIEEASIGNAPPSERGVSFSESSLVGDMVADFGGGLRDMDHLGAMSERTQTTALESVSITDNQSGDAQGTAPLTQDSMDDIRSVSPHLVLSPGASSNGSIASVTAMPPSVSGEPPHDDDDDHHQSPMPNDDDIGSVPGQDSLFLEIDDSRESRAALPTQDDLLDAVTSAAQNAGVVNRTIRPGRVRRNSFGETPHSEASGTGMRRSASLPVVDGFDFDKYDQSPLSPMPHSKMGDSYADLPGEELWSPPSKMCVSPLRVARASCDQMDEFLENAKRPPLHVGEDEENPMSPKPGLHKDYGTALAALVQPSLTNRKQKPQLSHLSMERAEDPIASEHQPLLQVPDFVGVPPPFSPISHEKRGMSIATVDDMVDSVFSSVRSASSTTIEEEINESDAYLASSVLARAFPERMFALLVTLMVEIPTVMMISGGSDRLCMLIGRSRYQLMMAFLPLSSAISGNVGLQASTLTTRAISHRHVTRNDFWKWFFREVGAAFYLGFGMGTVIGAVAFVASGYDFGFGFTIFMAQQVSILTAGITGTFAPLLFSFIFHRDSGKWGGPLETAVQDIVGSFAMVIMSYHLLVMLGPVEVDPSDMCGSF